MTCQHCGAETSNGLVLCNLCQRRVSDCLTDLPVYLRNLARWRRPGRSNGSLGAAGSWLIRRGEVEAATIILAVEHALNDVDTWTRALAEDRGIEVPSADTEAATFAALCDVLARHLTSVATLEWAGQFVRDMDRHERILRRLTEAAVPGWYAGTCRRRITKETTCGEPTYVVPGLTWVTCGACGATTFARDHLDAVMDEARDWVDRPKRLAEAAVALIDTEMSVPRLHDRIRQWGQRGRIEGTRRLDHDGDEVGPKYYRFGDLLNLLASEGQTRPEAEVTEGDAVQVS